MPRSGQRTGAVICAGPLDRISLNVPQRRYSWCSTFLIFAGVTGLGEAVALGEGAAAA